LRRKGNKKFSMTSWYHKPLGAAILKAEQSGLDHVLPNLFGFHLLQLGGAEDNNVVRNTPISHCMRMDPAKCPRFPGLTLQGVCDDLPFLQSSLDVVLLNHVLEFSKEPENILNEVDEALIPEGHVVIIGFNPYSLFRFAKLPGINLIGSGKVRKWLVDRGFSIVEDKRFFFRAPVNKNNLLKRFLFMEGVGQLCWGQLGAVYIIVAKKEVSVLTPIKEPLFKKKRAPVPSVAEPSSRYRRG